MGVLTLHKWPWVSAECDEEGVEQQGLFAAWYHTVDCAKQPAGRLLEAGLQRKPECRDSLSPDTVTI